MTFKHALGGVLISLPFLFILGTLIRIAGWEVLYILGSFSALFACVVGGITLLDS